MTRILIVRHGHVEGIDPPRFRGRTDVPLSDIGRREAARTAQRIAGSWSVRAIFTSPLLRCVETGRAIGDAVDVIPRRLDQLDDLDYGAWRWQTHDEVEAAAPDLYRLWFSHPERMRLPGGESLQDLSARGAEALRIVCALNPDDTVVMVSHDSVNRALLLEVLGLPASAYWRIAQSPCGLSEVLLSGEDRQVVRLNETGHLDLKEDLHVIRSRA